MKYLCLLYYNASTYDTVSPSRLEALKKECKPHDEALRRSGQLFAVGSLAHHTTMTLRQQEGKPVTSDTPFADVNRQVGAFLILEARDLNDAVRVASLHPAAQN